MQAERQAMKAAVKLFEDRAGAVCDVAQECVDQLPPKMTATIAALVVAGMRLNAARDGLMAAMVRESLLPDGSLN